MSAPGKTLIALSTETYAAHEAARELFAKQVLEIADRFRTEVAGQWYCRDCGRLLVRRAPAVVVTKRV